MGRGSLEFPSRARYTNASVPYPSMLIMERSPPKYRQYVREMGSPYPRPANGASIPWSTEWAELPTMPSWIDGSAVVNKYD